MKTIFPKADEMLLLDILANADNNVQKASEKLISLGYMRREMAPPPKVNNRTQEELQIQSKCSEEQTRIISLRQKEFSEEEKLTSKFKFFYKDLFFAISPKF